VAGSRGSANRKSPIGHLGKKGAQRLEDERSERPIRHKPIRTPKPKIRFDWGGGNKTHCPHEAKRNTRFCRRKKKTVTRKTTKGSRKEVLLGGSGKKRNCPAALEGKVLNTADGIAGKSAGRREDANWRGTNTKRGTEEDKKPQRH